MHEGIPPPAERMHEPTGGASSNAGRDRAGSRPRAGSPFLRLCAEIPELVRAISHHLTEEEDLVSLALACRSARDALSPYGAASNLLVSSGRGSLLVVRAIRHPWFDGVTVMQRHAGPDGRASFRRWRKRVAGGMGSFRGSVLERRIRPDGSDAFVHPQQFVADMNMCYLMLTVLMDEGAGAEAWRDGRPVAGPVWDALWAAFGPSPMPRDARLRDGFYSASDVSVPNYADAFARMGEWPRDLLPAMAELAAETGPGLWFRLDFRLPSEATDAEHADVTFPVIEYFHMF